MRFDFFDLDFDNDFDLDIDMDFFSKERVILSSLVIISISLWTILLLCSISFDESIFISFMLFLFGFVFSLIVIYTLTAAVSKMSGEIKRLAQKVALLSEKNEELRNGKN